METIKTQSSLVTEVGYDGKDLYVTLEGARRYKYKNVPYSEYRRLIEAESIGKCFNCFVRDFYDCERL